jgi:hypothetical protein
LMSRARSWARYTAAIPPRPSSRLISNSPSVAACRRRSTASQGEGAALPTAVPAWSCVPQDGQKRSSATTDPPQARQAVEVGDVTPGSPVQRSPAVDHVALSGREHETTETDPGLEGPNDHVTGPRIGRSRHGNMSGAGESPRVPHAVSAFEEAGATPGSRQARRGRARMATGALPRCAPGRQRA